MFGRQQYLCWIVTFVVDRYSESCLHEFSPVTLGFSHGILTKGIITEAWQMYLFPIDFLTNYTNLLA